MIVNFCVANIIYPADTNTAKSSISFGILINEIIGLPSTRKSVMNTSYLCIQMSLSLNLTALWLYLYYISCVRINNSTHICTNKIFIILKRAS